jgi:Undecaprenyl-phosphate glucose phosphotransferase
MIKILLTACSRPHSTGLKLIGRLGLDGASGQRVFKLLGSLRMSDLAQNVGLRGSFFVRVPYHRIGSYVALLDATLILCASILGNFAYHYFWYGNVPGVSMSSGVGIVACAVYWLVARSEGQYSLPSLIASQRRWSPILFAWAIVFLFLPLALFLVKAGAAFSRGSMIAFAASALMLLLGTRFFASSYLRSMMAERRIAGRRAVIIGEPDELASLNATSLLYRFGVEEVARVLLTDVGDGPSGPSSGEIAKVDRAIEIARDSGANEFVVALNWSRSALLGVARDRLRRSPLPVRLLPDHNIRSIVGRRQLFAAAAFAIELQREPLTKTERMIKRVLDVSLAFVILLLLSPLLLMVAIAIKLNGPGPVIFRQRRKGFNGRPFVIYKFRTMNVVEDGPVIRQATKDDSRVTDVGRVLRKSSIDELPQLLNVLQGDMSLVGPRPHAIAHDEEYGVSIANYACRHHVKPGLTGLAQVNGCRGETRHIDQMKKRVDFDLWYIDNWSLLLDLKILARTTLVPLASRDAY